MKTVKRENIRDSIYFDTTNNKLEVNHLVFTNDLVFSTKSRRIKIKVQLPQNMFQKLA